jgi:hypothetical protein
LMEDGVWDEANKETGWFLYLKTFPRVRLSHRLDDGGRKDLWNVGKLLPNYMALQHRRHHLLRARAIEKETTGCSEGTGGISTESYIRRYENPKIYVDCLTVLYIYMFLLYFSFRNMLPFFHHCSIVFLLFLAGCNVWLRTCLTSGWWSTDCICTKYIVFMEYCNK